jgi:hypothetical protein
MFTNLLFNPAQWLTYPELVAGLTEGHQPISHDPYLNTIDRDVCEIRGSVNFLALYNGNNSFESAMSGVDPDGLDQEDFRRMILLNRVQIQATVFDEQRGISRQVGKVQWLTSDLSQFQVRFRITHLPAQLPIRVEVLFDQETENNSLSIYHRPIQPIGWSGLAMLSPGKPLREANFALQ